LITSALNRREKGKKTKGGGPLTNGGRTKRKNMREKGKEKNSSRYGILGCRAVRPKRKASDAGTRGCSKGRRLQGGEKRKRCMCQEYTSEHVRREDPRTRVRLRRKKSVYLAQFSGGYL